VTGGFRSGWWLLRAALLGAVLVAAPGGAQAQGRLVAYGDSYVHPSAAGLREGQAPWPSLLGQPVINLGHAGDTVDRTLAIVRRTAAEVQGEAVVAVGVNDLRRGGADPTQLARFRSRYDELLTRLDHARRVVVVLPLPPARWDFHGRFSHGSDQVLRLYRAAIASVAARHPNVRVADAVAQWQPGRMLLPDGLHPNRLGRALLASTVERVLREP
jgi:lysophospholipase L1-like esterase